jgi:hypothetical protein
MDNTDGSLVVPQPGREKETIRLLLELADHPRHVRTNTDGPGLVLNVPSYLHERYVAATAAEQPPTPKRRGRPPGRTSSTKGAVEASEKDSED